MLVALVVLAAAAGHAGWNALAKLAPDPKRAVTTINAVVCLVGLASLAVIGPPPATAIAFAVGSACVHVAYNLLLGSSLALGDLSQVYPLARGTAPLLVALGAFAVGHETLSAPTLSGVLLVALGIIALARPRTAQSRRAVVLALATGVTIACYSLADGLGVRHSPDPLRYAALLFALEGGAVTVIEVARTYRSRWDRRTVALGALAGLLSYATYAAVLWAQRQAPLAVVSALRETSVVIATVLGAALGDADARRRVLYGAVVGIGVAVIVLQPR